jgi:hypothetical protein
MVQVLYLFQVALPWMFVKSLVSCFGNNGILPFFVGDVYTYSFGPTSSSLGLVH